MKRLLETLILIMLIGLILMAVNKSYSQFATNFVPEHYSTNFMAYVAQASNAETDLIQLLNTDKYGYCDFDEQVCKSLPLKTVVPRIISYQLISFVFHYPTTTNECLPSSTEMVPPLNLIYTQGKINRTNSVNEIPLNRVRIVDPAVKYMMAEIDLLIEVYPLGDPHAAKYFRRSFRFTYRDKWKQD